MLEFKLNDDNMWCPPTLDINALNTIIEEQRHLLPYFTGEWFLIYKTAPYIECAYIDFKSSNSIKNAKHFVIHENYKWSLEDIRFFEKHCLQNPSCGYNGGAMDEIFHIYSEKYPDWHLKRYYKNSFKLLDHIYNCLLQNTVKEILYKAGLDELSIYSNNIDEINLLSSKPSDIYDGLSMKILRSLNGCSEGASLLNKKSDRAFIKELNLKYPDLFSASFNDAQAMYLGYLIHGKLTVGEAGRLFETRKQKLCTIWTKTSYQIFFASEIQINYYKQIYEQIKEIDPIYENYFKKCQYNKDHEKQSELKTLQYYLLIKREETDKIVRRSIRKRPSDWQERHNDYIIRYPQTVNDFCREAIYMQNCLLTYIDPFIENDTTILFMRKADAVNEPFITIEIFKNYLLQAYHRFNDDCTPDEALWIIDYCKRHNIILGRFKFNKDIDLLM